jgi:succinate dehydrogenase / fumarate reductase, flavoprotein subunit
METTWTDIQGVLVIGAGAAGLRAAIAARQAGREALVLSSRERQDAHTVLAAGGINAVLGTRDPEDSWQQHCVDTYHEARGLSDPRAAELLAREAPAAIAELDEWGCPFARTDDGRIDQRFFGAHRYRRTCFVGDRTGRAILETLHRRALDVGVEIRDRLHVSRLAVVNGRCHGAVGFELDGGRQHLFLADACVLATGGHSGLWARTSSRMGENAGEGMMLAFDAGCRLADLELVQFHPSGMATPEDWVGTLVSEAVRGEGAYLRNSEGERYMERYDPDRMELSTRDRVALAGYTEISQGRGTEHAGVWLDATHLGRDVIEERIPGTAAQYREALGVDIAEEQMEVAPTAHYSMGGVLVDPATQATDVPGLYGTGEVTAGLHGANRLGGNSLAETVVFGRRAGEAAAQQPASPRPVEGLARVSARVGADMESLRGVRMADVRSVGREVGAILWECCGVVRSDDALKQGLGRIASVGSPEGGDGHGGAADYEALAHALRVRDSARLAQATLRAAVERRESRGAHVRDDYPEEGDEPARTVLSRGRDGVIEVAHAAVPGLPPDLAGLEAAQEHAGQLLE